MPTLLLSPSTTARLDGIRKDERIPVSIREAISSLPRSFSAAASSDAVKMDGSSPAVPCAEETKVTETGRLAIPHRVLVDLACWARTNMSDEGRGQAHGWTLWDLVAGSEVYVEPKKVAERSKELEASLLAIRKAQDEAMYHQLTTSLPFTRSGIPASFRSIAGVDPSAPLAARISAGLAPPSTATQEHQDAEAWREVRSILSVLLNVLLSIAAVVAAVWYGLGTSTPVPFRVLVSLLAAIVTALAETALYARYGDYVSKSRSVKERRLKGSDAVVPAPPPPGTERGPQATSDQPPLDQPFSFK
ncbi:uncharacterized protein PFL1_05239 [Pseudozyma flocculosa PF-1]|uniref:Endoplasmic reticulum-based factor for assembly of V-ATPase n=2 Tax=Pseudozyma flocculosa TaxID=84751 RepID=A0A5C3F8H1_9BASI|nr:uncharacterized protein PFL1_05239 [Pseudozyma flocculosa PF-1]EPQ27317.1 hypothetical protein PFL1_05239 [Pseudozyma flocculosa PF-1]SPO39689.1 uncharacterized protein PSFLO_05170 [Pseudozyma flocculosa]